MIIMGSVSRRMGTDRSILPLFHTTNILSSCYRDLKIVKFNGSIFRLGRRYEIFLRSWFSVGVGFSLSLLILIAVVTVFELASCLHLYEGEMSLTNIFNILNFGVPSTESGFLISFCDVLCFFISTLISVSLHELGHALSAASEGIPVDHIAIFIALIFPGALIALNNELLLTLPRFSTLRVYTAGIWHNAVLCAVCGSALFLLPFILHPFYIHGENAMVLDVSSTSPLSGHVSAGDIIVSLDDIPIHEPEQWQSVTMKLHWQALHSTTVHKKGLCVPFSLVEGKVVPLDGAGDFCKKDSFAFSAVHCYGNSSGHGSNETIGVCLSFGDVVDFNKCGNGWITRASNKSSCLCSEGDYCLAPLLSAGLNWVKVTYFRSSSSKCSIQRIPQFPIRGKYHYGESECYDNFIFVGNLKTLALSLQLTSYRPRLMYYFAANFPYVLEKILGSLYHISLTLAVVNSLPVYFLDGEAILEVGLKYFTFIGRRMRGKVLRACLFLATLASSLAFFKLFLFKLFTPSSSPFLFPNNYPF